MQPQVFERAGRALEASKKSLFHRSQTQYYEHQRIPFFQQPESPENRMFSVVISDVFACRTGFSKDPDRSPQKAHHVLYQVLISNDICTMDLFDAIHEMRRLSKEGKPFSFSFMSCNLSKGSSDGIVEVRRAKLISRESKAYHVNADFVERYMDLDTKEPRHFYQILLMTFNGQTVTLQ